MRSTFTFNGHKCDEFGIYISKKPNINRSQRKFKSASVAGRNGNIYQFQDAWDEVVVTYDIFAGGYENGDAPRDFTAIMEWLNSADDYAMLTDSYDTDHYRMAVFVDATNIEQKWYSTGQAQIKFRCKPQHYLVGEVQEVEDGDTIMNPTNHIALPIIKLTGAGARTMLNLERTENLGGLAVTMSQLYTITSQSNRYIATVVDERHIKTGGTQMISSDSVNDTNGTITFTATASADGSGWGIGYVLPVQADTDYTISGEVQNGGWIQVVFANAGGYNDISGSINKTINGSGWTPFSYTIHTPADCGYIMVIFSRLVPSGAGTYNYRKIMVNNGASALPFRSYDAAPQSTVKVGTVIAELTGTFTEAVIDCETENVSMDGANANQKTIIHDEFNNLSAEFLHLEKGDNGITYGGEVTGITIDPRFWEL